MSPEYTRQRQGRDFSMHETLMRALEASRMDNENAQRSEEMKKSFAKKLERFKAEAERNAVLTDGYEPPEKGRR